MYVKKRKKALKHEGEDEEGQRSSKLGTSL
jgi:hypothetical protein